MFGNSYWIDLSRLAVEKLTFEKIWMKWIYKKLQKSILPRIFHAGRISQKTGIKTMFNKRCYAVRIKDEIGNAAEAFEILNVFMSKYPSFDGVHETPHFDGIYEIRGPLYQYLNDEGKSVLSGIFDRIKKKPVERSTFEYRFYNIIPGGRGKSIVLTMKNLYYRSVEAGEFDINFADNIEYFNKYFISEIDMRERKAFCLIHDIMYAGEITLEVNLGVSKDTYEFFAFGGSEGTYKFQTRNMPIAFNYVEFEYTQDKKPTDHKYWKIREGGQGYRYDAIFHYPQPTQGNEMEEGEKEDKKEGELSDTNRTRLEHTNNEDRLNRVTQGKREDIGKNSCGCCNIL